MILTDLKMPVMDGVALIKTLKQQQNTTPVIVLSNYSDFELVREALTSGALDYVLKLDLTSEVLLTHLDKLAGHIKTAQISQAESGSRENQELLRSRLRSFFREPQVAGDAAPNLPVMFSTPFLVFTVYYQEGTVKIDRLRRVLPQVESFLKTTVGEIPLISLVLHHNELICMAGVSGERAMIENALKMLQRQLATYFSITPTICYCVGMESLADAKGAYERCREAYGLSFYDSGQTLYCAEEIHMEQGIRPEQVSALTGRILDALHAGDMEQVQQINAMMGVAMAVLVAIAAISLLVGGIGIMNIMLVSVTERTREIGIRKALGATYNNILLQFLIESAVIGIIGGFLGVLLGVGASYAISALAGWKTVISVPVIFIAVIFSVGIGVFFGIYPARKAALLDPIDALRYE